MTTTGKLRDNHSSCQLELWCKLGNPTTLCLAEDLIIELASAVRLVIKLFIFLLITKPSSKNESKTINNIINYYNNIIIIIHIFNAHFF